MSFLVRKKYKKLDETELNGDEATASPSWRRRSPEEKEAKASSLARTKAVFAGRIQAQFRRTAMLFDKFGETILCRKGGDASAYGRLVFPASSSSESGRTNSSPFIVVSDTTSEALLAKYIEKRWRIKKPEVIISVTGSAQDFNLPPQLQRAFDNGLASAATSANAWILTAGTDSGVMKLTANSLHKNGVKLPVIAVTPFGAVNGRHLLEEARGQDIAYTGIEPASFSGAPVNAFHTHFIMVESGDLGGKAWGTEIAFRARLEHHYTEMKGVTIVTLCVQGGPGTLKTLEEGAKQAHPALIVSDSGGAAAAVAEFVQKGTISDVKFQSESAKKTLATIKEMHQASGERLLTFFSLSADEDMSKLLLQAIVKMLRARTTTDEGADGEPHGSSNPDSSVSTIMARETARLTRAMLLANNWDRLDVLSSLVQESDMGRKFGQPHVTTLQRALELNRVGIVQMLLGMENNDISQINLTRLYLVASSDFDPYHFLRSQTAMHTAFVRQMRSIYRPGDPRSSYRLFKETVGPMLASISPSLEVLLGHGEVTSHLDLFVWSLLSDNRELAMTFWERCSHPLRAALLGSYICAHVAQKISWGQKVMEERSTELQAWAVGMLSEVPSTERAYTILSYTALEWGPQTVLDQAMEMERKEFLSHRYCQALMELWWRGDRVCTVSLPDSTPLMVVLLYSLVPLLNPHRKSKKKTAKAVGRNTSMEDMSKFTVRDHELVMQAAALSVQIAVNERKRSMVLKGTPRRKASVSLESFEADTIKQMEKEEAARLAREEEARNKRQAVLARQEEEMGSLTKPGYYSIPVVMYSLRCLSYAIFLLLFAYVLTSALDATALEHLSDLPDISWVELTLFLWGAGIFFDNLYQGADPDVPSNGLPFFKLLVLSDSLFVLAFCLRIAARHAIDVEHHNALYQGFRVLLSLDGIVVSLRAITFRAVDRGVGVLVIMLKAMVVDDLVIFLEIFLYITLGFCLAFLGIYAASLEDAEEAVPQNFEVLNETITLQLLRSVFTHGASRALRVNGGGDESTYPEFEAPLNPFAKLGVFSSLTVTSPFLFPFWAVYGEFDLDALNVPFAPIIMWMYVGISSVILVNLLVAMFSDTYSRIKANSELEFKFQKYVRIFQYLYVMHPVPPPFNMPIVLYGFFRLLLEQVCGVRSGDQRDAGTRSWTPLNRDMDDVEGIAYMKRFLRNEAAIEASSQLGITRAIRASMDQLIEMQLEEHDLTVSAFNGIQDKITDVAKNAASSAAAPTAGGTRESQESLQEMENAIEARMNSKLEAALEAKLQDKMTKLSALIQENLGDLQGAMDQRIARIGETVGNRVDATVGKSVDEAFGQLQASLAKAPPSVLSSAGTPSFGANPAQGRPSTSAAYPASDAGSQHGGEGHKLDPRKLRKKVSQMTQVFSGRSSDIVTPRPDATQRP